MSSWKDPKRICLEGRGWMAMGCRKPALSMMNSHVVATGQEWLE
jgi:hypothetical protein